MKRVSILICLAVVLGTTASGQEKKAQDKDVAKIPEGVIHVQLPRGAFRIENIERDGKPLLRLTAGRTVIEAQTLFLGDAKGVQQIEAIKEGMHWVRPNGGKGGIIDGGMEFEPGSTVGTLATAVHLTVDQMKAGSLYVTTTSINFEWKGQPAKLKPKP